MKGKYSTINEAHPAMLSVPHSIEDYESSSVAHRSHHPVAPGHGIALIRGTMLELVRRDGRDLTARQLTTLLSVYLEDETHSVSSVARMLNISRPGVTRILDRLVEADLVSRAEDATDRRRVLIRRTRAGSTFVRNLIDVADQVSMELSRPS